MAKPIYQKPALTFQQQLNKLILRGMVVTDEAKALKQLSAISYYRLSAYWYPFRQVDINGVITSQFEPETQFEQAISLYEFDRKLRSLILDAIERIEVSIRTQFTYYIAHAYGAFGHTNPANFHPQFKHIQWLQKLEDEVTRSSDRFIQHYKGKYAGFPTVPIWMLTEVISLGSLSIGFRGLQNNKKPGIEDKKAIADCFDLHHKRLGDWLHALTYIRNVCAHHGRLWNRELSIRPDESKDTDWLPPLTPSNNKIFYILLILRYLLRQTGNGEEWAIAVAQLIAPIAAHKRFRIAMGMPENWQQHRLWGN